MKDKYIQLLSVAVIALIVLSAIPLGKTQDTAPSYSVSFLLQNKPDGDRTYELNLTIPQVLYQYYTLLNHATYSPSDVGKFITPYALKPIADRLWQIYNNTEDFTNAVLMIVHQIAYQESVPGKYPVEVLVNGNGDCDLFAFIAASILEAGGINTVLLYYKDKLHMEIGVDLRSPPTEARVATYSVTDNNVTYFIGECTGGKWRTGWRIGETPTEYQNSSAQVITLENMEQTSIGQVSANLRELDPSTVILQVSPSLMIESGDITVSGVISPLAVNENVTLQAKINDGGWTTIGTVQTNNNGTFNYTWTAPTQGSIAFQASWIGNGQFNGATSSQETLLILPMFLLIEFAGLAAAIVIIVLLFFKMRKSGAKSATEIISQSQDSMSP